VPMIRCPHCNLRQYAPATHATLSECAACGRPFAVRSGAVAVPVGAAWHAVRDRFRRRVASGRS
jgi:DNA-directed RNA polymerase subunit RPC12/RpoP